MQAAEPVVGVAILVAGLVAVVLPLVAELLRRVRGDRRRGQEAVDKAVERAILEGVHPSLRSSPTTRQTPELEHPPVELPRRQAMSSLILGRNT